MSDSLLVRRPRAKIGVSWSKDTVDLRKGRGQRHKTFAIIEIKGQTFSLVYQFPFHRYQVSSFSVEDLPRMYILVHELRRLRSSFVLQ